MLKYTRYSERISTMQYITQKNAIYIPDMKGYRWLPTESNMMT